MWNDLFTHLGNCYQAVRVVQDSGLWTYDPETYRVYVEAWVENRKAQKGR